LVWSDESGGRETLRWLALRTTQFRCKTADGNTLSRKSPDLPDDNEPDVSLTAPGWGAKFKEENGNGSGLAGKFRM
jgi:hypothetical protein